MDNKLVFLKFTSKYPVLILLILLFVRNPAQVGALSFSTSYSQYDFSHRYIILLDGINSFSSGTSPLNGDFEFFENKLIEIGMANSNIVYFSYGAAAGYQVGDLYCVGWKDGCSSEVELGDLSYLYLFPNYDLEDTHLPISMQAKTLEWLIGQVIKKDAVAEIDLIGFSQGGLIAAYWGSHMGLSSPYRSHVQRIIALESPLGGIPLASQCVDSLGIPICPLLKYHYGENLLRALQLPGTLPGSIVDELPKVADYFSFTSIQSSSDYTVNGRSIPLDLGIYGYQEALIGQGSQSWIKSKQKLYKDEELGGYGISVSALPLEDAKRWITENHHAPLSDKHTLDLITNIINSPPHNEDQMLNESEEPIPQPTDWLARLLDWWQETDIYKSSQDFINWINSTRDNIDQTIKEWEEFLENIQDPNWWAQKTAEFILQLCGLAFVPATVLLIQPIKRNRYKFKKKKPS